MFLVDAHQDIAYNTICFGRDYRRSAMWKRQQEQGTNIVALNGTSTIGLPEAIAGRVAVVFATIFVAPQSRQPGPYSAVEYSDPRTANQLGMQQLDLYHRLVDEDNRLKIIESQADLDTILATWEPETDVRKRVQGLVILMENADPIIEPKQFEEWYERGVRIVGPAWQASRYSGGTGMPGPLTHDGRRLLEVMSDMNAVLDLSHMAEQAFYEALERYEGPIIASHSNPRRFCDTDRHLSDDMILALSERDGVMGVVLANNFLKRGWTKSDGKGDIPLDHVIDVIDHICQVTGSAAHVGIGSDFDGGFGAESIPYEMDTVADLWRFKAKLEERGFSEDDVSAMLSGNMLRKLRQGLS